MKKEIQCKENLHDLSESNKENYPRRIINDTLLPDDDECHRGKMKANVVLKFMEIHCDNLSRPKQKYKRNL